MLCAACGEGMHAIAYIRFFCIAPAIALRQQVGWIMCLHVLVCPFIWTFLARLRCACCYMAPCATLEIWTIDESGDECMIIGLLLETRGAQRTCCMRCGRLCMLLTCSAVPAATEAYEILKP